MRASTLAAIAAFVFLACSKPKPSAEYAESQATWDSLTTRLGDDAYKDPEMDQVVALLGKVPSDSADAAAAAALKAKIASERERIDKEAKTRKSDLDVLRAPVVDTGGEPYVPPEPEPGPAAPKEDPVEASGQPQIGLPYDEFSKKFGGCFTEGEMIMVSNLGVKARAFKLNSGEECGKRHSTFGDKWVLFNEGKLLGMVAKDTVKQVPVGPPAGAAPPAPPAPAAGADAGG